MKEKKLDRFIKIIKEIGVWRKQKRVSLDDIRLNEPWDGKLSDKTKVNSEVDPIGARFIFDDHLN